MEDRWFGFVPEPKNTMKFWITGGFLGIDIQRGVNSGMCWLLEKSMLMRLAGDFTPLYRISWITHLQIKL